VRSAKSRKLDVTRTVSKRNKRESPSHKRARMKTRVRAIDQTWDVWRWRRVDRYTSRGHGRACSPASSYNDTSLRRVPTTMFSDSAELVSNWRGAIKCRHERARPGNAPIRQPDVTGRRVAARNTVTFNVKWLSKEKLGIISCSRARACLGLYKVWTDRRIYTSLSRVDFRWSRAPVVATTRQTPASTLLSRMPRGTRSKLPSLFLPDSGLFASTSETDMRFSLD